MKKILAATATLFLATSLFGAVPDPLSNINVTLKDEGRELAAGFVAAFRGIKNVPTHVVLQREGKTIVLPDIRSVTAVNSVLVLENGKGQSYVVNPRDVMWFTDTPVEKPTVAK